MVYKASANELSRIGERRLAHARRLHTEGTLLMFGISADSDGDVMMGVFTTRAAAEEFVKVDAMVRGGAVADCQIREWSDILDDCGGEANLIREWNMIVDIPRFAHIGA